MKRHSVFILAGLVLLASSLAHGNDDASIRAIPERIVSGWSRGDGAAVASVYADAGTLVAGDGTVTRGRAQIARYHERLFASFLKGTRLTVEITGLRFLGANVALVHTEGGILWPGESELAAGNRGIQSFIVVKEAGTWRLELFQNTRVLLADGGEELRR